MTSNSFMLIMLIMLWFSFHVVFIIGIIQLAMYLYIQHMNHITDSHCVKLWYQTAPNLVWYQSHSLVFITFCFHFSYKNKKYFIICRKVTWNVECLFLWWMNSWSHENWFIFYKLSTRHAKKLLSDTTRIISYVNKQNWKTHDIQLLLLQKQLSSLPKTITT